MVTGLSLGHLTFVMRQLKNRPQFLHAARGDRISGRFFALQANSVDCDEPGIGYTVTKRTGNSPERSRIKRRLRAAVGACQSLFAPQHDYVLIGRRDALSVPFATLVAKLEKALTKHQSKLQATNSAVQRV